MKETEEGVVDKGLENCQDEMVWKYGWRRSRVAFSVDVEQGLHVSSFIHGDKGN